MLKSVVIGSGPFTIPSEAKDVYGSRTSHETRLPSVVCSSSRAFIPKLEPFSRTKFERAVKDRPLIEKSESELSGFFLITIFFCSFGYEYDFDGD